jgi:hypothetical protein
MADNPKPARTTPATSDDFRRAAQLAGTKLRERLPEDSEYATHFPGFDSYNAKNYQAILGELMEKFKKNVCSHGLVRFMWSISHAFQQEFQDLHPGGAIVWGAIRLITQDDAAGNSTYNKDPGEIWALPLLAGGDSTIGQPLNRNDITEVKEGQIFLGYKVTEAWVLEVIHQVYCQSRDQKWPLGSVIIIFWSDIIPSG